MNRNRQNTVQCMLSIDPKAKPQTDHIVERIAAMVMGDPFEKQTRISIDLPPKELKKYRGPYRLVTEREAGRHCRIIYKNNRLYFDFGKGNEYEMLPQSKTTFFIEGKQSIFTFTFNDKDQVSGMVVHFGGKGGRKIIFEKE